MYSRTWYKSGLQVCKRVVAVGVGDGKRLQEGSRQRHWYRPVVQHARIKVGVVAEFKLPKAQGVFAIKGTKRRLGSKRADKRRAGQGGVIDSDGGPVVENCIVRCVAKIVAVCANVIKQLHPRASRADQVNVQVRIERMRDIERNIDVENRAYFRKIQPALNSVEIPIGDRHRKDVARGLCNCPILGLIKLTVVVLVEINRPAGQSGSFSESVGIVPGR